MIDAIKQTWQFRILHNGPRLVSALLAALIVAEGLRTILPLLSGHPPIAPQTASASRENHRTRAPGLDVQSIVAAHLFGIAADDSQDPAHALPTTANLVLQGTIATRDPKGGIAIITAEGPAKVYKVGGDVAGASLHSVYLDHIVLDRNGRLETLSLPRLQLINGNAPRQSPTDSASPEEASNRRTLADLMRAEPSVDDESNSLQGFRIRPGRTAAAFVRSGLRSGDLVTAVNGTPLADQDRQRSQQLVDTMLASGHATVSVIRNGKPVEVAVESPQ